LGNDSSAPQASEGGHAAAGGSLLSRQQVRRGRHASERLGGGWVLAGRKRGGRGHQGPFYAGGQLCVQSNDFGSQTMIKASFSMIQSKINSFPSLLQTPTGGWSAGAMRCGADAARARGRGSGSSAGSGNERRGVGCRPSWASRLGHAKRRQGRGTWVVLWILAQSQEKEKITFHIFLVSIQTNSIRIQMIFYMDSKTRTLNNTKIMHGSINATTLV
jgi:hypothetical protein